MTDSELIQAVNDVFAESFEIPPRSSRRKRKSLAISDWTAWTSSIWSRRSRRDSTSRCATTTDSFDPKHAGPLQLPDHDQGRAEEGLIRWKHADGTTQDGVWRLCVVWLNVWFWSTFAVASILFLVLAVPYGYLLDLLGRNRRRTLWYVRRTISHYGAAAMYCGWPLIRVRFIDYAPGEAAFHLRGQSSLGIRRLPDVGPAG